jgi:Ca2+-binding EF-hand superfamily protein
MKISNTGAGNGSFEIKKQQNGNRAFADNLQEKNLSSVDSYQKNINTSKEAIDFDGAGGIFLFRSVKNDALIKISVTTDNIERFKNRFDNEITMTAEGEYILSGRAEKYISAFWEYYKEKQPDTDNNGYIDYEEFKSGKSLLTGYDEDNQAPVATKLSDGFSDAELEKAGINSQTKVSVDEDFNGLLLFDANIDGIISKNEIGNEMTTQWVGNGKDITMLRWLLWIAEGMQDEEKNKKQKQTIDSENLRRKLTENLNSLPNTQNGGKLAEVLQNLKNSLK